MSSLRDALTEYVAMRRALGAQLRVPAAALGHFVEYLEAQGAPFITTELALRWAQTPENAQRSTWAGKLTMVRQFAAWLSVRDIRTEIPPRRILDARRQRHTPYIFSSQQVAELMLQAARLTSRTGLRALTYVTLIGLLASTGLRPGEALALDAPEVDLQDGVLTIRQTKFGKSRFVPVEDSTRTALGHYARQRDQLCRVRRTDAFFLSERGTRLQGANVRRTFRRICRAIGLHAAAQPNRHGGQPRLQDFRHSFVTKRLIEWYRAGVDIERELPRLSTYLGHVDVAHTYWYIQAVPELLQLAAERVSGRELGGPR